MGSYIYTEKKSLRVKASLGGQQVTIGQATFLCRDEISRDRFSPEHIGAMTRISNSPEEARAEYICFSDFDGARVFKSNRAGIWSDSSGEWSGLDGCEVGTLYKIKGKYHLIPNSVDLVVYMNNHTPQALLDPQRGDMHVRINRHYTATVRSIQSLESYLNAPDSDVELGELKIIRSNGVPKWFEAIVKRMVKNHTYKLIQSLPE
jgi:hypothetical protein